MAMRILIFQDTVRYCTVSVIINQLHAYSDLCQKLLPRDSLRQAELYKQMDGGSFEQ
jgi:hypothetical protein